MRLALTADWIMPAGGAEQVIAAFLETFPGSPLYCSVASPKRAEAFQKADLHTSGLQRWYRLLRRHEPLLPWMPHAMEQFDLSAFDVVLSSSHAVGKGILPRPQSLHICYCHTPMRYAWFMEESYLDDFHIPRIMRPFVRRLLSNLRAWDLSTAKRVDLFIANSTITAKRIQDIYGRSSVVLHPPVADYFFSVKRDARDPYFLAVGRMVPYKRFDLLVEAANKGGFRLKIAGSGPEESRLRRMAGPNIEFLGRVDDVTLSSLYANADALLFPQEEDAGIVLLEAQACGTPVIAYKAGGASDLTREGLSSILFEKQTVQSLLDGIETWRTHTWDRSAIRDNVRSSSTSFFQEKIQSIVSDAYKAFQNGTFQRS